MKANVKYKQQLCLLDDTRICMSAECRFTESVIDFVHVFDD